MALLLRRAQEKVLLQLFLGHCSQTNEQEFMGTVQQVPTWFVLDAFALCKVESASGFLYWGHRWPASTIITNQLVHLLSHQCSSFHYSGILSFPLQYFKPAYPFSSLSMAFITINYQSRAAFDTKFSLIFMLVFLHSFTEQMVLSKSTHYVVGS